MLHARIAETGGDIAHRNPGPWVPRMLDASPDGRVVIEWRQGERLLVARLRPDGGGASQLALLRTLSSIRTRTLRVPEPVTWLEGSRALVTGPAQGRSCRELDPETDLDAFERIGRALSELHNLDMIAGPARRLLDHLDDLIMPTPRVLAAALPQHARVIGRVLARLERQGWVATPVVSLNRDLRPSNLIDDGVHVTLHDWDHAATGDPAFDVGDFIGHVRRRWPEDGAEAAIEAFRRGYGGPHALWTRVPIYEQVHLLRAACRCFRMQASGWQDELESLLDRLDD